MPTNRLDLKGTTQTRITRKPEEDPDCIDIRQSINRIGENHLIAAQKRSEKRGIRQQHNTPFVPVPATYGFLPA